jgi:hypothetical protein
VNARFADFVQITLFHKAPGQKKGRSSWAAVNDLLSARRFDDRFHVIEVGLKRLAASRSQAVFGFRNPAIE